MAYHRCVDDNLVYCETRMNGVSGCQRTAVAVWFSSAYAVSAEMPLSYEGQQALGSFQTSEKTKLRIMTNKR